MNKRIYKKIIKKYFLECFSKNDWKFYNKYPRLFATYSTYKDFTLNDVDRWYEKFICNKDIFQNIVKVLNACVNFDNANIYFKNNYSNLEKYKFKDLMNNIEEIWITERLPKRIEEQLAHYLKYIPKMSNGDALRNVLSKIKDDKN